MLRERGTWEVVPGPRADVTRQASDLQTLYNESWIEHCLRTIDTAEYERRLILSKMRDLVCIT